MAKVINPNQPRSLSDSSPGATEWGLIGDVGGSWGKAWSCSACSHRRELLVWKGGEIIFRQCYRCWWNGAQQLTLGIENDATA